MTAMASLAGLLRVRRIAGLLPPFGVTKRINGQLGCTYLFGVPIARFVVMGQRLVYRRWPIAEELDLRRPDGVVTGRGRLFDLVTFCRFQLEPERKPSAQVTGAKESARSLTLRMAHQRRSLV